MRLLKADNSGIKDCFTQKLQTAGLIYIIRAVMKDFNLKKLAVPEVVLLAILVIGLIISHSIVLSRSYIKLSAPNEVPASGFSFCMPKGVSWQTMPASKYAQNSWFLTSVQSAGAGKSATRLTVSYLLAGGHPDVNDWLTSKAVQLGESIGPGKIIKGKDITIHAAMVDLRGRPLNIYYGIAFLPGGRSVMIELIDTTDDPQWGWDILTRVGESFVFKGNPLLEEGQKVIASLRSKGLGQLIGAKQEEYFLIGTDNQPQGFSVEIFALTSDKSSMNVRSINSYYFQRLGGRQSILQTNDKFERFSWISNELTPAGVRHEPVEVRLDVDGTMSVGQRGGTDFETYVPGPAAVPETFSTEVFRQMIADGTTQAIIDFINPQGQIWPAIVQLQSQPEDSNNILHIVKLTYAAGEDISEQVHLDAQGRVEKDIVSGKMPYVLTRDSKEAIINEFPAWLDYIMNLDTLLKENKMEDGEKLRRVVRNAGKFI